MPNIYINHNQFKEVELSQFSQMDLHLRSLSQLKYQYHPTWWDELSLSVPGIYILTGGRQIGKSTSCKLLIKHCLEENIFNPHQIFYLPCDEIFDAKELGRVIRSFIDEVGGEPFLLIIDEVTFIKSWDRVIKGVADEGSFLNGVCLLTGSDTLILKEAAMRFPGRRGFADKVDFHLYPLSFSEHVDLVHKNKKVTVKELSEYFKDYLQCGGYLRAINDFAKHGKVQITTFLTYEQWIHGDFLNQGKSEEYLLSILRELLIVSVSQISYSKLTQKVGLTVKTTLIDYCNLLERIDVLINLQAFDQNKKRGFPKKDRKFNFFDPFIYQTILKWLQKEGCINDFNDGSGLVESCVASHCYRYGKTFYFKAQGEIDIIWLHEKRVKAIEVRWSDTVRPVDLKMLKQFKDSVILTKNTSKGKIDGIKNQPICQFLYDMHEE